MWQSLKHSQGPACTTEIHLSQQVQVRELRVRDSEDVAVFGSQLLTKHAGKLGEENCECSYGGF